MKLSWLGLGSNSQNLTTDTVKMSLQSLEDPRKRIEIVEPIRNDAHNETSGYKVNGQPRPISNTETSAANESAISPEDMYFNHLPSNLYAKGTGSRRSAAELKEPEIEAKEVAARRY